MLNFGQTSNLQTTLYTSPPRASFWVYLVCSSKKMMYPDYSVYG